MTFETTGATRSEVREGVTWVWVDADQWTGAHREVFTQGGVRFEWLTAVHNSENNFDVISRIANENLERAIVLVTRIDDGQLATVSDVHPQADFHEREIAQMFGVQFTGRVETPLAFVAEFEIGGYPLRRDYALSSRITRPWPGAIEPDVNAKRRPALPPGVFPEWKS